MAKNGKKLSKGKKGGKVDDGLNYLANGSKKKKYSGKKKAYGGKNKKQIQLDNGKKKKYGKGKKKKECGKSQNPSPYGSFDHDGDGDDKGIGCY